MAVSFLGAFAGVFVWVGVTVAAEEPAGGLDGIWKLVSVEVNGEERQIDEDVRWLIKKETVVYGGEPLAAMASYPASMPKGIDLKFQSSKKELEGIYVVEGDRLRICLNTKTDGTKERPFEFSTKDKSNLRVFNFQRLSPDDGTGPQTGFVGMVLDVEENTREVRIQMILENSPGEKAGLRDGDIVLSVGNDNVKDLQTTVDIIRRIAPGSELRIRVRRQGNEKEIAVKVGVFPFELLGLLG